MKQKIEELVQNGRALRKIVDNYRMHNAIDNLIEAKFFLGGTNDIFDLTVSSEDVVGSIKVMEELIDSLERMVVDRAAEVEEKPKLFKLYNARLSLIKAKGWLSLI